ncbi:reverse transcriptase-like protein [Streptococcus sp. zg-86]|uniref:Reverse transcriptase-like protein n=1 Tax=Streptococcus zhangguiae TaxID=2664091 RepID=A0A6I4RFT3_9STRE|nr:MULTISPECIES: RNase H family protein [unclassified Streptococcus]MTB64757.1 reverse transcriptase-like protein [Streptococcus sp. zg-86]MTB91329.1 reverse transcriptase-like protein [Streptococcus sp. zg-36]MWV56740.1 reverse transcriptase-like protein [Streptococcus sp. zg-70]QTH48472.1 reverse transcriptase-like protein [Streptococcus sp. zg-86]
MAKYILYTDGSFHHENHKKTVSAYIVLDEDGNLVCKGRSFVNPQKIGMQSSTMAELRAVIIGLKAIRKLDNDHLISVNVLTDYQGLPVFHKYLRRYKKNRHVKEIFKQRLKQAVWRWYYSNLMHTMKCYESMQKELQVTVSWVKAHSGNAWNNEVDQLAKRSIGKR